MAKIDWRTLAKSLRVMTEDEVKLLLDEERAGPRRALILRRLHQRYAALRTARERVEILAEAVQ
jgi:hypothetical protein